MATFTNVSGEDKFVKPVWLPAGVVVPAGGTLDVPDDLVDSVAGQTAVWSSNPAPAGNTGEGEG